MLWVRVNNRWREVMGKLYHPTGPRYVLVGIDGEPDTVLVWQVERDLWSQNTSPLMAS